MQLTRVAVVELGCALRVTHETRVAILVRLSREGLNREQRPTMELSARMFRQLQTSEDLKEGVRAWREKRAPRFDGPTGE